VTSDASPDLEQYRRELTGYCYRMLGSGFETDDAVQETMVRAWKNYDTFEGRSALRSWLYRIATNVCLDMLRSRQRRARPMELSGAWTPESHHGSAMPEATWITPIPDASVVPDGDPADVATARESIRLAFVAALQRLPPRQRAALLLAEVLGWSATEIADALETSVAAVNSALQRARATLADDAPPETAVGRLTPVQETLLARYVDAFERYDVDALTALLCEDATLAMPPYALWLRGPAAIRAWLLGRGSGCRGSRLVPTAACGSPAFGQYRPGGPGGSYQPWALIVLELAGDQIAGWNTFLDTEVLFPMFGLPQQLPASPPRCP